MKALECKLDKTMTLTLIVDDDIYEQLKPVNITDNRGYPRFTLNHCNYTVANYVLGRAPKGYLIDHIDGNTYDCRRENLRFATHSQNTLNAPCHSDNQSGYRGVSTYYQGRKYRARIKIGEHVLEKTGFNTAEEAAEQYNRWLDELQIVAPRNQIR